MSKLHVEESIVINAVPERVYTVLSDYHTGHPAILPKQFTGLEVEEGGQGAGTVLWVHMNVMGSKRSFHMKVSEPEPGRVLVESDLDSDLVTTFRIDPIDGAAKCRVTIASDFTPSPGFSGLIERYLSPPLTRRIYRQELQNLAQYVQG